MTGETPKAKAKPAAKADKAASGLSVEMLAAVTTVPNNNPALTVAVLGDAPTFLPIIGWSIGEGAPVVITPYGEQPLDGSHVLHDNAQRKYLVGGKWVKEL